MAVLIQYANGVPAVKFSLEELQTCIGRGLESDICVADQFVSKQHAIIVAKPGKTDQQQQYYIRDLGSTNHTYVNDLPVKETRLKDRDVIRLGEEKFVFECGAEPEQDVAEIKAFTGKEDTIEQQLDDVMESALEGDKRFSRRLRVF